jgi:hypothetical protein
LQARPWGGVAGQAPVLSPSPMRLVRSRPMSGTLRRFFELLDGPDAGRSLEMLAADLRFSILFSNGPGDARDFAGGRAEFEGYMAQRGAPEWTHHVVAEHDHDGVEVVLGETRASTVRRWRRSWPRSGSTATGGSTATSSAARPRCCSISDVERLN